MADIVCSGLHKSYGNNTVFDNFSHIFTDSSITVVTGPSGCGKTTLLRLIAGLEPPDLGMITGGGMRECAFSFSDDRLFEEYSALENVACVIPHRARTERLDTARELLLALGLDESALREPVRAYSGGMKRRVTLARTFAAERPVLLLDEPTAGLDSATRELALNFIKDRKGGATLIAVTHSPSVASSLCGVMLSL